MNLNLASIQFEVNVLGAIHAVNAFLPLLRGGSAKKIILVSGGSGQPEFVQKVQMGAMATLSITKCALGMVGVKYSVELKDEGFTVVAVNPGWVDTSATAGNQGACECLLGLLSTATSDSTCTGNTSSAFG